MESCGYLSITKYFPVCDSLSCYIKIPYTNALTGGLSIRVEGEQGYKFYLWRKSDDWTKITIPVPKGLTTITWSFDFYCFGSSKTEDVWVDDISFLNYNKADNYKWKRNDTI
ncbi:MAG: hypothetical protein KA792_10280, partial [Bacteroidales bacterium]|nr:hypothetical protein [Bacteroidales bacterium]